jgi:selenium metabolism protein YedF
MSEITVDARGQPCPKPLIMTKQALQGNAVGTAIAVRIDNETSCRNVERFLRDNGMPPRIDQDGAEFTVRFIKIAPELAAPDAAAYCLPARGRMESSYVVTLAGDTVGRGSAELGGMLMHGLLATLAEATPLPTHVLLYSSAVLLAAEGSPHVAGLRELERRGVKILLCGTCVDFYRKKTEIRVGSISSMLTILEVQLQAGKIIAP